MNSYLDAEDNLWNAVIVTLTATRTRDLKQYMNRLLFTNLYNMPIDGNNPIQKYGTRDDAIGNRSRLFADMNAMLDSSGQNADVDGDLRDMIEEMFEVNGTATYIAMTTVLTRYIDIADEVRVTHDDAHSSFDSSDD